MLRKCHFFFPAELPQGQATLDRDFVAENVLEENLALNPVGVEDNQAVDGAEPGSREPHTSAPKASRHGTQRLVFALSRAA
jgi:hypothetical protein